MAPEQAGGEKIITTQADVYGLGAILYELLTNRPPFKADNMLDTLILVRGQEPVQPGTIQPFVDHDLETICLKCLEKEPARRYSSAEAVAEELERWVRGEPVRVRPAGMFERTVKWMRARPALAAVYLLTSLLFGVGILAGGVG